MAMDTEFKNVNTYVRKVENIHTYDAGTGGWLGGQLLLCMYRVTVPNIA